MTDYDKAPTNPHHGGKMMPHQMADYIEELEAKLEEVENTLALADDQRKEWEIHCKSAEAALKTARVKPLEEAAVKAERYTEICQSCAGVGSIIRALIEDETKASESSKVIQKTLGKHRDALQRLADR